jgi:hypothetical protein
VTWISFPRNFGNMQADKEFFAADNADSPCKPETYDWSLMNGIPAILN